MFFVPKNILIMEDFINKSLIEMCNLVDYKKNVGDVVLEQYNATVIE